jgi:hypothetical protein
MSKQEKSSIDVSSSSINQSIYYSSIDELAVILTCGYIFSKLKKEKTGGGLFYTIHYKTIDRKKVCELRGSCGAF